MQEFTSRAGSSVQADIAAIVGVIEGDTLYWHGSSKSRMLLAQERAPRVCLTVTILDGLVVARSGFHMSVNYRSAMLFGKPYKLTEPEDKLAKILAGRQEPLIVRGHTDRRPYRTATYDNWRLSAARAHAAYTMLARGGIDEKRFERIEGYADRALRVPDDPEAAQNRRIEILLRKQGP